MGDAFEFCLNGRRQRVCGVSPTTTLLDYLRLHVRLTGTKEGCAEGDCGACTVAISRRRGDGGVDYQAMNSCLMIVPQVEGCSVLTVEGLARSDGTLHPVQQSLVAADATQCGFCTPGFVMAMFAFAHGGEARTDETIHEALAGNLCRCTGYRPIVEACRSMRAAPPGCDTAAAQGMAPFLGEYRATAQRYLVPRSLEEMAEATSANPDAVILGGGTDLGLRVSKDRIAFPAIISTAAVPELQAIADGNGVLTIGGGVTYTRALPYLDRHFGSFAALVRRIGSRQIRNLGTLAGNLANASPIGDTIPCLMALEATVTLRSRRGARQFAIDDFIVGYRKTALDADEFIESISIPWLAGDQRFVAYKLSKRFDQDISTVVAAFRLRIDRGQMREFRAAYGGMAAQVARARKLEAAIVGRPWSAAALADIDTILARDFSPMTDHRGTEAYRRRAAANLVRRLQVETTDAGTTQVWTL